MVTVGYPILITCVLLLSSSSQTYGQITGSYTHIAVGPYASYALRADGQLWAWGSNSFGQLGDGTLTTRTTPIRIPAPTAAAAGTQWTRISAGDNFAVALRSDGVLWAWGGNNAAQLGNGTMSTSVPFSNHDALLPIAVAPAVGAAAGTYWSAISAGNLHALALRSDGSLWGWGANGFGQLGIGPTLIYATTPQLIPSPVGAAAGTTWTHCAAGSILSFGIRSDGTLWSWGAPTYPSFSALGHPSPTTGTFTPQLVPAPATAAAGTVWTSVATGGTSTHTLAIRSDGTLWAWGWDRQGELGQGLTSSGNGGSPTPLQVALPAAAAAGTTWVRAAVGEHSSLGLLSDGTLWGWGDNYMGILGINLAPPGAAVPTQEYNHEMWSEMASGLTHSVAISRGQVYVTGTGAAGQLGLGNNQTSLSLFVRIAALPLATSTAQSLTKDFYPNPVVAGSILNAPELSVGDQVVLVNMQGQTVATCQLTTHAQFRLPNLPAGLYLLHTEQAGQRTTTRKLAITQ